MRRLGGATDQFPTRGLTARVAVEGIESGVVIGVCFVIGVFALLVGVGIVGDVSR